MSIEFKVSGAPRPGGFVAMVDGYNCFLAPVIEEGILHWKWSVQSGGGWSHRGGREVQTHVEGVAWSAAEAEQAICDALEQLPS